MRIHRSIFLSLLLCSATWGQTMPGPSNPQADHDTGRMSGHDMSNMKEMPMSNEDSESSAHVMHSMEGHMEMGPHMKMTALLPAKPGDAARAQQIAEQA